MVLVGLLRHHHVRILGRGVTKQRPEEVRDGALKPGHPQRDKPNYLSFNVIFSFMVLRHLLFYSASNPFGFAANEAAVSMFLSDLKKIDTQSVSMYKNMNHFIRSTRRHCFCLLKVHIPLKTHLRWVPNANKIKKNMKCTWPTREICIWDPTRPIFH